MTVSSGHRKQNREIEKRSGTTGNAVVQTEWHHRHLLDTDILSREEIELVFNHATAMEEILGREIKKVPTLRSKTIVNMFFEASTRTRASFDLAAKALSADVINITASGSSVEKGESLLDTVLTIQSLGADVIIMRHQCSGAPYFVARNVKCSVINAGDGWHAHPTQALLDMFTIHKHKNGLKGLKIVIVGDILHSRVARSNIHGLAAMGARVIACGPPTLMPVAGAFPAVKFEYDLDRAIQGCDVVMPLRLQLERQQGGLFPSTREYSRMYQVTPERLSRANPGAIVLHPGPMNEGIEISPEVAHGPQSVVEEQVANGVAVRMALLTLVLLGTSYGSFGK
ncbi:MAG: aspartate carbamoyltransferase catalytic subunit [Dehalococcoidia bacterium]|nr:aspartate carbamoyltransferase catalytic subunit [Dehalococcoidia bacterium]MDZ4246698.1 aspartate carbamoyltransferase catalytic subunit [Dehalococcoidia bacterium]